MAVSKGRWPPRGRRSAALEAKARNLLTNARNWEDQRIYQGAKELSYGISIAMLNERSALQLTIIVPLAAVVGHAELLYRQLAEYLHP